jgi:hypothetical protein
MRYLALTAMAPISPTPTARFWCATRRGCIAIHKSPSPTANPILEFLVAHERASMRFAELESKGQNVDSRSFTCRGC